MTRMIVILHDDERKALQLLAETERRHPREQAAMLIRCELERRGILSETAVSTDSHIEGVQHANNPG